MFQFFRSSANRVKPSGPSNSQLSGIPLFEQLVSETHLACLQTAVISSAVNALGQKGVLKAPWVLRDLISGYPNLLHDLSRSQKDLGLALDMADIYVLFAELGNATERILELCEDAEQLGIEQAAFLHINRLRTTWRHLSRRALLATKGLDADVQRCLPERYAQNTTILKKLLTEVVNGAWPCVDGNGFPFVPDLPQRRPAARHNVNQRCIVEHLGRTQDAVVKDASTSGLGLERLNGAQPGKIALVELANSRCLAGTIVWAKGATAGLKFDAPLNPNDPLFK